MQDLRLIGVHEDGEHLLLSDLDGGRFRVRVDEPLRTAVRHDRPRLGQQQVEADASLRPRDVQALIRAGSSAEEVAERSGWSVDKVRRYEGPIVAEREHVAGLSRGVRVRGRSSGAGAPTLSVRVAERLKGRGVDPSAASWDAWREEGGPWTVVVTFAAGGRQRQASWHFDLADRTVTAIDDEARWLSEEEEPVPGPIPAPHLGQGPGRTTTVYDVEAEGGLRAAARPAAATVEPTDAERPVRAERDPEPLDLMTAMRERSTARGRRKSGARRGPRKSPTNVPGAGEHVPDDAVPLEDMAYDPETMPPPPAAHAHPDLPDPLDARPEPQAAAWAEAAGLALDDVAPAPHGGGDVAPAPHGGDDVAPAPHGGDDAAADADEPEVAAVAITAAETETAEVLESVQSLESPHRTDEPVATPADIEDDIEDDASGVAPQDVAVEPASAPEPAAAATVAPSPAQDPAPGTGSAPDAEQPEAAEPVAEQPEAAEPVAEEPVAQERTAEQPEAVDAEAQEPEAAESADEPAPKPVPPARPSSRRNGRPSVPSWDDIMFGARPGGRS